MDRIDDLSAWRIFCEIVNAGGLNAACEKLDIEPSKASRFVRDLEDRLGASLFSRSSRRIELTDFGRQAHEKILLVLAMHEAMLKDLRGDRNNMAGLIRVTSHAGIGPAEITPALIEFQKIYPDIQFELHELSGTLPEGFLTEDGRLCDVAIGYGEKDQMPGCILRYSGDMPFIPCASPLYLKKYGAPVTPEDCERHTGILINSLSRTATKTLSNGSREVMLRWKNTLTVHNLISAKTAVMLGAGIVPDLSLFHCREEIDNGHLVPVMQGWRRRSAPCYVFAREEAYEKRRVKVFVEWIAEREYLFMQNLKAKYPQFYT